MSRLAPTSQKSNLDAVDRLLDRLAADLRRAPGAADPALLRTIDDALSSVVAGGGEGRRAAVLGLVGLRRALFPSARAYGPASDPRPDLQVAAE